MLCADKNGKISDTHCFARSKRDVERDVENGHKVIPDFENSRLYQSLHHELVEFEVFNEWLPLE